MLISLLGTGYNFAVVIGVSENLSHGALWVVVEGDEPPDWPNSQTYLQCYLACAEGITVFDIFKIKQLTTWANTVVNLMSSQSMSLLKSSLPELHKECFKGTVIRASLVRSLRP